MKLRSKFRSIAMLGAVGLTGGALLAGCGGDDGATADSDPQQLLEETFTTDAAVESGVLDISLDAAAEGKDGGTVTASLSGPFDSSAGDEAVPLLDMMAALAVTGGSEEIDFEGGLTITADGAFVTVDGTAYEVDEPTFQQFKDLYAQSAAAQEEQTEEGSAVFGQLGIDPSTWLTDVTNEGTEEIEGEETVHISGTADVAKIIEDAQGIAQQTGQAPEASAEELGQLSEAVTAADVDVYTGAEDKILRRLDLTLEIADTGGGSDVAAGPVSLTLSIGISGVNDEQEISAPADAQPIDELIPGGLGAVGALGGGSVPGLPDDSGAGGAGGGDVGNLGNQEYLDCVAEAGTPEEITACADLL